MLRALLVIVNAYDNRLDNICFLFPFVLPLFLTMNKSFSLEVLHFGGLA